MTPNAGRAIMPGGEGEVTLMIRILLSVVLLALAGPACAINMSGFKGTPIVRLTAGEQKAFRVALIQVLNEVPDRSTTVWRAAKTPFTSRITPLNRFEDQKLRCRETLIESETRDHSHTGRYVFCRDIKRGWQFKKPEKKPARKKP